MKRAISQNPIVEMGLLMEQNGIPLAFDLFPGNESEKVHMRPVINRVKNEFSDIRIIFVADKGLNTSDNIYYLNEIIKEIIISVTEKKYAFSTNPEFIPKNYT